MADERTRAICPKCGLVAIMPTKAMAIHWLETHTHQERPRPDTRCQFCRRDREGGRVKHMRWCPVLKGHIP